MLWRYLKFLYKIIPSSAYDPILQVNVKES